MNNNNVIEGILLVDKPEGWTSFDVVNYIRKMVAHKLGKKPRNVKVGHTGTLDPAATGLLVICVGKTYTKKVPQLIAHDKEYVAEITFGASSDTGDKEGVIAPDAELRHLPKEELEATLRTFIGTSSQVPPAYSALKVNGVRAYTLAREGKPVNLQPRTIQIDDLTLLEYSWPTARVRCRVSSGTYIRVLAEDIGRSLGTSAYLSSLRRTGVGDWSIEDAVDVKTISIDKIEEKLLV